MALDQLQRSKRKMLPIVNGAGELVSPPSTSMETEVVCSLDACQLHVGMRLSLPLQQVVLFSIGTVCAAWRRPSASREAVRRAPAQPCSCWGLSIDESETKENRWLHA